MAKTNASDMPRLSFSGHETFSFRYGWLKKVYDQMSLLAAPEDRVAIFRADDAIAEFGVGKNMVASMKHWGLATGLLVEVPGGMALTNFANFIFDEATGHDPYLDNVATLWLLHWKIATNRNLCTSWFFAFNVFGRTTFDKSQLVSAISEFVDDCQVKKVAEGTLVRDVDCLINTYVMKRGKRGELLEDSIECPLTELGVLSVSGERGVYVYDVGPKPDLESGIFYFALSEYLQQLESKTASLENVVYDLGSPGRVFKLDDEAVAIYLNDIEAVSGGAITWRDSAGLRQVQVHDGELNSFDFLRSVYKKSSVRTAAA